MWPALDHYDTVSLSHGVFQEEHGSVQTMQSPSLNSIPETEVEEHLLVMETTSLGYATDGKQETCCAVSLKSPCAMNYGVLTCDLCRKFFRTNCNKLKLKCKGRKGDCVVQNVYQPCSSCRMKKCRALGMDLLAKRKVHQQLDRATLESRLISLRNHRTPNVYVLKAVKAVVRKCESAEDVNKLLYAVENGEVEETECVRFPHKSIKIDKHEHLSHVLVAKAFRWNRVSEDKVVSSHSCKVNPGYVCINPYHYRKKKQGPAGTVCVVTNCNFSTVINPTVGFFRLPDREKSRERYLKFFSACARQDLDKSGFRKHHRICGRHFLESDFKFFFCSNIRDSDGLFREIN
ncbi:uncharacterized protein LOC129596390 [Paramacrobiotus metropolitanus]|uniref:uncharacterized protein LOC129596390 n=1 Tax=Paramacrobiotus metropolitanus TaxID=2943436 RepID=UPI002445EDD4|nr:uncharacterized protein LOC129596390 [Paramacrobiotus metropolitanus]XP_055349636.1 uncharacterized protein LOC129596390 [Paramacrobiotus metropolitanus]XP_055349637.1 uncharacterized protein LOC129596390 [Paramacrobiotus metropolitanus]XP_055349638.1 uncharacterized protein LOC129596390 [Paramacrobiotus metropolitanus]XP_055349639.1 uncharacterized protein LOC129596390 [Paramacrobiotus metropolitanus]